MCGRFNLTASGDEVAEAFGLDETPELAPRYNIAPTQPIAVVGVQPQTGRRGLASLHWGLVPRASPGGERGFINARAETAWAKPAFREAFARRRCLIPATGFYEWQNRATKKRQPWLIRMAIGPAVRLRRPVGAGPAASGTDRRPAPSSRPSPTSSPGPSTTACPSSSTRPTTPSGSTPQLTVPAEVRPLLRPFPAEAMTAFRVTTAVNRPAFDDPSCLTPA